MLQVLLQGELDNPAGGDGLRLDGWHAYLEMLMVGSKLRADIKAFFDYADIDGNGGLDAGELLETQATLNMNLLTLDDISSL